FLKMWGYVSEQELIGKIPACEFWKDRQDAIDVINSLANTRRESWQGEAIGRRKDGSELNTAVSASLVKDEFNKPICVMASIVDITDRKQAEEKLRLQKEELRDFVQFMAHDLGNSLSTIIGFGKLAIKKADVSLVEKIISQTEFMKRLLQRSLTLADAGLAIEKTSIIDLNNLINRVAQLIVPPNIKFINEGNIPILYGDQAKLSQVFKNLFENAIVHGKPSYIEVLYSEHYNHYEVQVNNDGKIVPPKLVDLIFKRGYSTTKSTGLGLTIIKKIVEAHGWKIELYSSENKTTFKFIIPKD
ncbi:MAG: PAS domain-containing sensor histidine kinase, partial [Candidatus Hodarchaeales archaeon]